MAPAANIVWEGDVSTDWFVGGNWTGNSPPGVGDVAHFDGVLDNNCDVDGNIALTGQGGGIQVDAGYTGTLQFSTGTHTHELGEAGLVIDGGTIHMGDAVLTITDGPFDYLDAAGWTTGTGSVTLAGACTVTGDRQQQLYDFDLGSGTVTIHSDTDARVEVTGTCTIHGPVVLNDILAVTADGDMVLNEGASFSGSSYLSCRSSTSGHGLTALHSSVTVGNVRLVSSQAGARLAAGTYGGYVRLAASGAANSLLELDSGTYDFDGGLELENKGTGLVTLQNKTNAPLTINVTDLTIDLDAGAGGVTGNIVIDDDGVAVAWVVTGNIVDEETGGGAFSWVVGTSGGWLQGTADQAVDTNSVNIGWWGIYKPTSGKVTINDATLQLGAIDAVGDGSEALVITNSTITSSSAAKNFVGASANSADVNFSDAGNDIDLGSATWTITNGDFDYATCGTLAGGTSTIVLLGTGTVTGANGKMINDFTVNASGGAITLAGELECADWTHTAGSVDFGGQVVEASGDFSVAPGCTFATGGAGLDGADVTVGGNFTVTGSAATDVDMTASAWTLNVTGSGECAQVNVTNSNASAGSTVRARRSVNSGGNANWLFPARIGPNRGRYHRHLRTTPLWPQ